MNNQIPEPLAPLMRHLRPDTQPCLFLSQSGERSGFTLTQFTAGRDVTYIFVARAASAAGSKASEWKEVIDFSHKMEGVEIIYDATDGTMQGKARPFTCDLTKEPSRLYAVLPFQIEGAAVSKFENPSRRIEVQFFDAREERIQAALPLELTILGADRKPIERGYLATNREGWCDQAVPGHHSTLVVRSLLTGFEQEFHV